MDKASSIFFIEKEMDKKEAEPAGYKAEFDTCTWVQIARFLSNLSSNPGTH